MAGEYRGPAHSGKGFWYNLRLSDKKVYREAMRVERLMKKIKRCECTLKFLFNCRNNDVFPKFVCWKNVNRQPFKKKSRYYRRILLDEIDEKTKYLKTLKTQLTQQQKLLYENTTWIRGTILRYTLDTIITKDESKWIRTHNEKVDNLISEKKAINGISENPNLVITNLSSCNLNNNEYKILTYGLQHGIAKSPKQNDILASSEHCGTK